ncbi:hypothetical protein L3Q82_002204 [Scortum barcoo]|uniref:Uncharacterized protein n=1 Tax=Scortum barcoo TaxID=214431 RepID=A0ACB8W3T6_9TELE|nr:hypothetical protein L3Q82_002204 [Scortum barcoo]
MGVCQPVHMCFVDLEKAFTVSLWYSVGGAPRVWGPGAFAKGLFGLCTTGAGAWSALPGSKSDLFPVHVGLRQGCPLSPGPVHNLYGQDFRRSQGPEGVRFGNHRISSLLFADDVVLMASSGQDLQHVLERFAAECEAGWDENQHLQIRGHGSRPEKGGCPLQVGGEVLPQVEEFKYLGVLFTSEGKIEREIDRRIGAASAVMRSVYRTVCGEEGAESKGEALDLPVNLRSHPHLWS